MSPADAGGQLRTSPRLHRLANGVRVIADPMPGLESVGLSVVVHSGARWEKAEELGWSHLLEHMVFKGAGVRGAHDIVEAIEAKGGQINAATGYERTSFQVRGMADVLTLGLEICADLIRRPTLTADDLVREKQVVGQEIAEAADTPDDRVFDLAQAAAFENQPLGRPILGTTDSVDAATPARLRAFHRGYYAPERLCVAVAGRVDEDDLLRRVEALFGDMQPSPGGSLKPQPAVFSGGDSLERRRLEQAQLVLLLPGVGLHDRHYFTARLFAEVLGGGMASRLFQEVREKRGLAYAIDSYAEAYEDVGLLGVYAGLAAEDAGAAATLIAEEIVKLAERVSEAELARAKAQLKAHLYMGLESPLTRAEHAAGQALLFNRLLPTQELAAAIEATTPDDFRAYGEVVLSSRRRALATLGSKRAGEAAKAFDRALA
jgi:predicted Zn-dependent peptidase